MVIEYDRDAYNRSYDEIDEEKGCFTRKQVIWKRLEQIKIQPKAGPAASKGKHALDNNIAGAVVCLVDSDSDRDKDAPTASSSVTEGTKKRKQPSSSSSSSSSSAAAAEKIKKTRRRDDAAVAAGWCGDNLLLQDGVTTRGLGAMNAINATASNTLDKSKQGR